MVIDVNGNTSVASMAATDPLAVAGSTLYFVADDGVNGSELWRSDGTDSGTVRLASVNAAFAGLSNFGQLTPNGNALYFTAFEPTTGIELWKYDTAANTLQRLSDIAPGPVSSNPSELSVVGDTLYFAADAGTRTPELWKMVPCARQVAPLPRDVRSVDPRRNSILHGQRCRGQFTMWRRTERRPAPNAWWTPVTVKHVRCGAEATGCLSQDATGSHTTLVTKDLSTVRGTPDRGGSTTLCEPPRSGQDADDAAAHLDSQSRQPRSFCSHRQIPRMPADSDRHPRIDESRPTTRRMVPWLGSGYPRSAGAGRGHVSFESYNPAQQPRDPRRWPSRFGPPPAFPDSRSRAGSGRDRARRRPDLIIGNET
jgi:ELWxxDGT repeat protein